MATVMKRLPRVFRYEGTDLVDPAPTQTPDQVLDILAVSYPQLVNAAIEGPAVEAGKMVYTVKVEAGAKG